MPRTRRQWIVSPSMTTDSSVVIGTPSWPMTAAADGVEVFRPTNSRAKLPPPISSATASSRQRGRGIGNSHGSVASATTPNLAAA
jgi:hypothetical protein